MSDQVQPPWVLEKGTTLLRASAGTGKTHSITDCVLWLIAERELEVGEILVVTFTEAATAELRDRVRRRLRAALDFLHGTPVDPKKQDLVEIVEWLVSRVGRGAMERRLESALRDFDQAEISTIHGFCNRTLQRHAFESGVEFDVELVTDLSDLIEEVARDFWVRRLHDAPEVILRALEMAGVDLGKVTTLAKIVAENPELPVELSPFEAENTPQEVFDAWQAAWQCAREEWGRGREEAVAIIREAVNEGRLPRIVGDKIPDEDGFARWVAGVDGYFAEARTPDSELPEKLDPVFTCNVKKAFQKTREGHPVFDAFGELLASSRSVATAVYAVVRELYLELVEVVRRDVAQRKREQRIRTFSDLLHDLRAALASSENGATLREALSTRYKAALLDEFQDTDPVQWEIFREVFANLAGQLCLIGDPKQAIYSFRGADIHTYLAAKKSAQHSDSLGTNYRSDEGLVDAVNHLFDPERLPHAFILPIPYTSVSAHHRGKRLDLGRDRAPLEIRFCRRADADMAKDSRGNETGVKAEWARQHVSSLVTSDIVDLLESRPMLSTGDEPHPLEPRDIAILVRTNKQARVVQGALREASIPSVLHGDVSVFATLEATELSLLLAAIVEPSNVRAAKTALSTELIGFRASLLADIEEKEVQLWERWVGRLRAWRSRWLDDGFMRMFRQVLNDRNTSERVLAWVDGERRMTDLLHLAELIHSEASRSRLGPRSSLSWLKGQIEDSDVVGDASELRLESDSDAVEIITMHKAKGLQYPVVYCPFLWAGVRAGDAEFLRYHHSDSRRLDITPKHAGSYPSEKQVKIAAAKLEAHAEDMRLLYVALTRAEYRCVVYWGWFNTAATSPLNYLLHGRKPAPPEEGKRSSKKKAKPPWQAQLDEAKGRYKKLTDQEMLDRLEAISDGSGGTIEVTSRVLAAVNVNPSRYRGPSAATASTLKAREWRRSKPIDRLWRRGSFSALTRLHGPAPDPNEGKENDEVLAHESEAAILELHSSFVNDPATEAPGAANGSGQSIGGSALEPALPALAGETESPDEAREIILTRDLLPGGRHTGNFFHELYEHLDFTKPEEIGDAVIKKLDDFGFDSQSLSEPLSAAVRASLDAPMGDPSDTFSLADIPFSDRICELEFDFPVSGGLAARGELTKEGLSEVFRAQGSPVVPEGYADRLLGLGFSPLRGFMTGAIDLIFRRNGLWYVADYKSNYLGDDLLDYEPDKLAIAMSEGHYFLQYHLYTLATHRWLRWRLPSYSYEESFGGVFYFFLRGMAARDGAVDDARHGVFFDRPSHDMISALDALMLEGDRGSS